VSAPDNTSHTVLARATTGFPPGPRDLALRLAFGPERKVLNTGHLPLEPCSLVLRVEQPRRARHEITPASDEHDTRTHRRLTRRLLSGDGRRLRGRGPCCSVGRPTRVSSSGATTRSLSRARSNATWDSACSTPANADCRVGRGPGVWWRVIGGRAAPASAESSGELVSVAFHATRQSDAFDPGDAGRV
jgi:hypothetical protein